MAKFGLFWPVIVWITGSSLATMVCHRENSGHLFKLPDFTCDGSEPRTGRLKVFKRNIKSYTVKADSMTAIIKTCVTKQFFFGSKTTEKSRESARWSDSTFKDHILGHSCQDLEGQLTTGPDMEQGFACRFSWPTRTVTKTVTCVHKTGYVSTTHGGHLISDLGLIGHCEYSLGYCITKDRTALTWIPNQQARKEYLLVGTFNYAGVGDHLLVPKLGMSFDVKAMISQGPGMYEGNGFRINLEPSKDQNTSDPVLESSNESLEAIKQEIAQKFQFIMDKLSVPEAKLATLCEFLEMDNRMMKNQAQANPTSFLRTLLKDKYWIAEEAGDSYLMGYPCLQAHSVSWRKSDNKTCYADPPVFFILDGLKREGYLNVRSEIIQKDSAEIPCTSVKTELVSLNNQLFSFDQKSGPRLINKEMAIVLPTISPNVSNFVFDYPLNYTYNETDLYVVDNTLALYSLLQDKLEDLKNSHSMSLTEQDALSGLKGFGLRGIDVHSIVDFIVHWIFNACALLGTLSFFRITYGRHHYRMARTGDTEES